MARVAGDFDYETGGATYDIYRRADARIAELGLTELLQRVHAHALGEQSVQDAALPFVDASLGFTEVDQVLTQIVLALAERVKNILVIEMNCGQMLEDVQRIVGQRVPVHFKGYPGGKVPTETEIFDAAMAVHTGK